MPLVLVTFMEAAMFEYKIKPLTKSDAYTINKTLVKELKDRKLFKNVMMHLRKGIALKLEYDGEIAGFFLAKEFQNHFSMSYYYIYPKHRRKIGSFFFFTHCLNKMKHKAIFVKKNHNFNLYKKYFHTTIEDDIIQFKGLREEEQWAALLKRSKKL